MVMYIHRYSGMLIKSEVKLVSGFFSNAIYLVRVTNGSVKILKTSGRSAIRDSLEAQEFLNKNTCQKSNIGFVEENL